MRIHLKHIPPFVTYSMVNSRDHGWITWCIFMGPDAYNSQSIADVRKYVQKEEHGLVLPNKDCESALPFDGNSECLVVLEICWWPFMFIYEVIQKCSCWSSKWATILRAEARSIHACILMLLSQVVCVDLIASKICARAWHLDGVHHLFKCKAAAEANSSGADGACTQLSTAYET